jgi:hypothetical protein
LALVPKAANSQAAELVVNQRDELSSGLLIAGRLPVKQSRYIRDRVLQVSLPKSTY